MRTANIILACASIIAIDAFSTLLVHAQSFPLTFDFGDTEKVTLVYNKNSASSLLPAVSSTSMINLEHCPEDKRSILYLNHLATSYHRQFEKVEPDIYDQKLTPSNLLFRAGILSIKPSPPQVIKDSAEAFVTWYEDKHGKVDGDTRSAGEKLLHFSIEGLFLNATNEHREWQERFGEMLRLYRTQQGL